MTKKVLLTGGTGLIGKESVRFLKEAGFEIFGITNCETSISDVNWINCDLFNHEDVKKVFDEVKPEYLLNFAWITGGDYLTNPKNLLFKNAGIKMLEYFKANGGKRAVYAGTCFEYDITAEKLSEKTPVKPSTLYAQSKNELHIECEKFSKENGLSFGWGRIFYVFGHNENPTRLTAKIIDSLLNNNKFQLGAPNNFLDYMYTKDIANAFVKFLQSEYVGSVNICTGKGILLKDYALKIQELMGKKDLIEFERNKPASLICVGDNTILKNIIGFEPVYNIDSALKEIVKPFIS